jgi:hypothetical protein
LNCTAATPCTAGPAPSAADHVVITGPINGTTNSNKLAVLRPYTGYGPGLFFVDAFTSNYHSLQAQLQKHFSGNSIVNVSYTWSHGRVKPFKNVTGGLAVETLEM